MAGMPNAEPCVPSDPVETIAADYLIAAKGDARVALRCAITDALADLVEAERRCNARGRLVSRGYVRGVFDAD